MICFKNAKVFSNGEFIQKEVFTHNGKIIDCNETESNYEIFDCHGLCILPSCIDINIFPQDKKLDTKSMHSLTKKAIKGGVSTIFLNPYTIPNIDNEAMNALVQSINNNEFINIFPLIGSVNSSGKLNDIDTLSSFNSNAKAIFSDSAIGSNYLYQTMQYAKMLNIPVCIFPFDFNIEQGTSYESSFARALGLPMITPIGQIKEVAKIKEMAKFLQIEVILMSMNISYCIDLVCHEKNIHTQVGLPHLIFSERDIKDYDTKYKMMPPLLTRSKKEKLIKRLQEKKVVLLTSMHKRVSQQFKEQVFEYADDSVDGIEYLFSAAYTFLVKSGIISMDYLIKLLSTNASDLMRLNKGKIQAGKDADFMIVDLDSKYIIDNPISPYNGLEVFGKIKHLVVNGKVYNF